MEGEDGEIINSQNLKVHTRMKELYKFFAYNGKVVDIEDFDKKNLKIFSRDVLKQICSNEEGWGNNLPEGVPELIKKDNLFNYLENCEIRK